MRPNCIIIDTYDCVSRLETIVSWIPGMTSEKKMKLLKAIISDVMDALSNKKTAMRELNQLLYEVNQDRYEGTDVKTRGLLSSHILELGITILEQLKCFRVYKSNGSLPYELCSVTSAVREVNGLLSSSFKDILLTLRR